MSDDVQRPESEGYKEFKERLAREQAGKTKQDIIEETGGIDLDNLPKQTHNWVKRGVKLSCENAFHPHHSHFLVNRNR